MEDNNATQGNVEQAVLITKHQFYFDTPLYAVIPLSNIEDSFTSGEVDGYNPIGGIDTTFKIECESLASNKWEMFYGFTGIKLTCKRKDNAIKFLVIKNKEAVVKVGQWPSLADIQFAEIGKKYDGLLSEDELRGFKKAIELAAQGHGAGSFVYLRRVFEGLINKAFKDNIGNNIISEDDFRKKWMVDKVELLKTYLPSQLVEMKNVYKVLSKGVHELSEEECLTYFVPMKLSIELILDQKIEIDLKQKRDQKVKEEIKNIHQKLGK